MSPSGHVESLSIQAQQAMAAGRLDEAARLWGQVLAAAPDNAPALFHLGQHALYKSEPRKAADLLQQAARLSPQEPAIRLNLSFAQRALGDANAEMDALNAALAIDPYFFPALLSKGVLLDRLGKRRQAARVYKDALTIAPPERHLPPEMNILVAKARTAVQENSAAMEVHLRERMAKTRSRHAGASMDRFEECLGIASGTRKAYTQQPMLLHFPQLPAISFYDKAQFPWIKDVEAATDTIRQELIALIEQDEKKDFAPYVTHPEGAPLNQWAELNHSPRWSAYFLWSDGKPVDAHCARCPQTAALLRNMPMAQVSGAAPSAFFSTLDPKTRIPPHTGVTNTRLVVHVPLIVPEGCWFRVGNDTREWKPGNAWVFDDTIEHEAYNGSDKLRVILIFDIWNPYLSEAERDLVANLVEEMTAYYRDA